MDTYALTAGGLLFLMLTIRPDRFFLGLLSICLTPYAFVYATWQHPTILAALTLLLLVIEFSPIHLGKTKLSISFPILYAITIVTGFRPLS